MKLGKYDQKISFVTEGTTPDTYGGYEPTEATVLSTFARIEQLRTSTNIEQAQLEMPAVYKVGVQVRSGFTPEAKHLIKWRGETYKILSTPAVESVRYRKEWVFDMTTK